MDKLVEIGGRLRALKNAEKLLMKNPAINALKLAEVRRLKRATNRELKKARDETQLKLF